MLAHSRKYKEGYVSQVAQITKKIITKKEWNADRLSRQINRVTDCKYVIDLNTVYHLPNREASLYNYS
ncbi:MAG: hypothetical protein IFNCLDLE_02006 [Ignavibacteriaceae bacterium]|nr:hypothetical protein [Ignavibacteriaceae bacterium]